MKHSAIMTSSFIRPRKIPNQPVWLSQTLKIYRMDPFMTIVYNVLVKWFWSVYLYYITINKAKGVFQWCTFFIFSYYRDSHHARLNRHHKAWSYLKKKHKKIKAYRKSLWNEPTVNSRLLILNFKYSELVLESCVI